METVEPREVKRPVLVRVENVKDGVVEAFAPQFDGTANVFFPVDLVPEPLRYNLLPHMWLNCRANISTGDPKDLDFEGFELAPEPDPNDGLA